MRLKNILLILFAALFFSCKKNKDVAYNCPNNLKCGNIQCIAFWSNFNFTIIDKATGNDLIFGNNPSIPTSDIKLFYKANTQNEISKITDVASKSLRIITARDTMALQIKNEPLKTITVKLFCPKDCCSQTAVEIIYDGEMLTAGDNNIFRLKK